MNSEPNDAFIERLKLLVGQQSVRSFAAKVGVSHSVMYQYLSGKSDPTRKVMEAITSASGVRMAWLASGEGPMRSDDAEPSAVAPNSKKEHHPEDTISKKIAFNVMIALAPHFGITKEPAQDELAKLFLDLCDHVRENSNGTSAEVIDFGMRRVNRSQAS
jgi:hypothetical protein